MPEPLTARVDVRKAILATAATLAESGGHLGKLSGTPARMAAATARLTSAERSLVHLAEALAGYVNRRVPLDPRYQDALLVLKVDSRDVEAFSGDWLHAATPPPSPRAHWQAAHLVNAIDFGRWVVALSAAALTANRGDPDLHEQAVRTILDLDLALIELTRTLLGRRAECLAEWNAV